MRYALFVVAALSITAGGPAALAHADATDDAYVTTLQEQGIPGTPAAMIGNGRMACDKLEDGDGELAVINDLARGADLTYDQAGYELGAAVAAYCPQYLQMIHSNADALGGAA